MGFITSCYIGIMWDYMRLAIPKVENQREKKLQHEMETGGFGRVLDFRVKDFTYWLRKEKKEHGNIFLGCIGIPIMSDSLIPC